MSGAKKFKVIGYAVERSRIGGGEYVLLTDYDAAQSELAALREELANTTSVAKSEIEGLSLALQASQQRLAAAEQRNAAILSTLEECVTEMFLALEDHAVRSAMTVVGRARFLALIKAHEASKTKPTESGASE